MQKAEALKEQVLCREQTESSRVVERLCGKCRGRPVLSCGKDAVFYSRLWRLSENRGNGTVPRVKGSMSENQGGTVYMHPWTWKCVQGVFIWPQARTNGTIFKDHNRALKRGLTVKKGVLP